MSTATPAHDFLLPRLTALLADAEQGGIARDVAVAVLIDIVTGNGFNLAVPDPKDDTEPGRQPDYGYQDDKQAAAEMAVGATLPGSDGSMVDGVLAGRHFHHI